VILLCLLLRSARFEYFSASGKEDAYMRISSSGGHKQFAMFEFEQCSNSFFCLWYGAEGWHGGELWHGAVVPLRAYTIIDLAFEGKSLADQNTVVYDQLI